MRELCFLYNEMCINDMKPKVLSATHLFFRVFHRKYLTKRDVEGSTVVYYAGNKLRVSQSKIVQMT